MKQLLRRIKFYLYRLFKPVQRTPYTVRPLRRETRINIGGQIFWRKQLVGKSVVQLQKYFVSKGLLLSTEELEEVHAFINNKIIK